MCTFVKLHALYLQQLELQRFAEFAAPISRVFEYGRLPKFLCDVLMITCRMTMGQRNRPFRTLVVREASPRHPHGR